MAVSFLSPWFLMAGAAAAVPILIHLLQRRKEVTLPFSTVKFILLARKRSSRRLRLRRILLLLLRVAAVLILTLILARPVIRSPASVDPGRQGGHTVFILDNSLSMSNLSGGAALFDLQRDIVRQAAAGLPVDERVALIPAAAKESSLSLPAWRPSGQIPEALNEIDILPATADFVAAFGKAYHLLQSAVGEGRRIVVTSDLLRGGWEDFTFLSVEGGDATVPVILHRIGGERSGGSGILEVAVTGESRVAGDTLRLTARIVNWGPESTIPVEMRIDGRTRDRKVVTIPPGEEGRALFELIPGSEGEKGGEVLLEEDDYSEDDRRYFSAAIVAPVRVLAVDGDPRLSLVESETFFLREALRSERLAPTAPMEVRVVGKSELEREDPGEYDVIIMANVPRPGNTGALTDFVNGGGSLVIFWGDGCDPGEYRQAFGGLLPMTPSGVEAAPEGKPFRIGRVAYDSEIFTVFRPPSGGDFSVAGFRRRLEVEEVDPAAEVLVSFTDGKPWLATVKKGRGNTLLIGSTADLAWNDLATKPLFVPLMRRIVLGLTSNLIPGEERGLLAGEPKIFSGEEFLAFQSLSVEDPSGSVRKVEYRPGDGAATAIFSETWERGLYAWEGPGSAGGFAVNVPPAESDRHALTEEDVRSRFQQVPLTLLSMSEGGARAEFSQAGRRSLTRPLFIALFFLLLAEMLVAGPRMFSVRRTA